MEVFIYQLLVDMALHRFGKRGSEKEDPSYSSSTQFSGRWAFAVGGKNLVGTGVSHGFMCKSLDWWTCLLIYGHSVYYFDNSGQVSLACFFNRIGIFGSCSVCLPMEIWHLKKSFSW